MALRMPSQLKCRGSMQTSFDEFVSAHAAMDCTEVTQDILSDLNHMSCIEQLQELSYNEGTQTHVCCTK